MPEPAGGVPLTGARTSGRRTITRQLTLACDRIRKSGSSPKTGWEAGRYGADAGVCPNGRRNRPSHAVKHLSGVLRLLAETGDHRTPRRPDGAPTEPRQSPDRATPDDRLVVGRIPRDVRGDLGGGPILPRSFARIANLAIELPATRSPRSLRQTPVTSHTVNALRSKGAVRWSLCGQPRRDVSAAVCRSPPSTSRARHRFPRGSRRRTNLRLVAPLTLSANQ
jgi:hypothetical protein